MTEPKPLSAFVTAYLECALWSSTEVSEDGDMGECLDENYGVEDFAPEALAAAVKDCEDFQEANADDLADIDDEQAGHDFWLTRNRHGAGFWDRGLGDVGDRLTEAAHAYGSVDLYAHDGKVYGV